MADAYKSDQESQREFRKHGSICYDPRILSWKMDQGCANIWTLDGRQKIPFVCGDHRLRRKLQKKGTKSAKRLMRRRRRKEQRFARDVNHQISKKIVGAAQRTESGIALEDLKGIRGRVRANKKQRRSLHSWSFGQLQEFILYKAKRAGVPVQFVDARNTSRTCGECGCVDKRNRKSQAEFVCVACGHTDNADANAAREISRRAAVKPAKRSRC